MTTSIGILLLFALWSPLLVLAQLNNNVSKYSLPSLPYALSGLEPVLSADTVNAHYNVLHRGFAESLYNLTLQVQVAIIAQNLPKIIALLPQIEFNAGGYSNHNMYWENLAPINGSGGKFPNVSSALGEQIVEDWGSFENLTWYFGNRTVAIAGDGWGWLVWHKVNNRTQYAWTEHEDSIYTVPDVVPLLAIDIWEHSYFLDYQANRAEYMKSVWEIVNWQVVEKRFTAAKAQT